jgi:serine/threonine protein kinase
MHNTDPNIGKDIGPYKIVSLLGRGGMGSVYLAERLEAVHLRVALKILKGSHDAIASQRFMRERQLLARLKHSNIARIIDAGETEENDHWFAMELVEGMTLDAYVAKANLSLEEKLKLFRSICDAVSYAHQNLIIHRDLKPSNILVTKSGKPMLLDFGVAGILDSDGGQQTQTLLGRAFTPQYASPEQMRGEPLGAASDVYALGLIFYELVTGMQPYLITPHSPQQAIDLICEKPITKPSDALASSRSEDEKTLRSKLRGDLDTIATKALAKTVHERYQSVEQMSLDIDRYLVDLPIYARPASLWYRTGKLLKRNALLASVITAAFLVLLVALGYTIHSRNLATRETHRLQKSKVFLENMFKEIGPRIRVGSPDAARDLLRSSENRIPYSFSGDLDLQAEMLLYIMESYNSMGYSEEVERMTLEFPVDIDLIKDKKLRERAVLSLVGICRTDPCIEQQLEVFNKVAEWDVSSMSDDELQRYFFVLGFLHDYHKKSEMDIDFGKILKNIGDNRSVQVMMRLAVLIQKIEKNKEIPLSIARNVLDRIDDELTGCNRIYEVAKSLSYLYFLAGAFSEGECLADKYINHLEGCLQLTGSQVSFLRKQHDLEGYRLINDYALKKHSTAIDHFLTNQETLDLINYSDNGSVEFYYSVLLSVFQKDLEAVWHLNNRFIYNTTLLGREMNHFESYIIIGQAYLYLLEENYAEALNLLEGGLLWPIKSNPHIHEMKTLLAKTNVGLGRTQEAKYLLREVESYQSNLDTRSKALNWYWLDEADKLMEQLKASGI